MLPAGVMDSGLALRAARNDGVDRPLHTVQPPSMMCATPVVNALSSLARYTASEAISSAVPRRPIGCRATNISRPLGPGAAARAGIGGVSMGAGQMQLQ